MFVTPRAAEARGTTIAEEFIASFTLGAGQFCTKPGTIIVPAESGMVEHLRSAALPQGAKLLNGRIQAGYVESLQRARPAHGLLLQGWRRSCRPNLRKARYRFRWDATDESDPQAR